MRLLCANNIINGPLTSNALTLNINNFTQVPEINSLAII
jgi:hypothetical protein